MKDWNIKTDLIEEVSHSDKLTATIKRAIYLASVKDRTTIFD